MPAYALLSAYPRFRHLLTRVQFGVQFALLGGFYLLTKAVLLTLMHLQ